MKIRNFWNTPYIFSTWTFYANNKMY